MNIEWKQDIRSGRLSLSVDGVVIGQITKNTPRYGDIPQWIAFPCIGPAEVVGTPDETTVRLLTLVEQSARLVLEKIQTLREQGIIPFPPPVPAPPKNDEWDAAYQAGFKAYGEKLGTGDNPHRRGSPVHEHWLRGWNQANHEGGAQ